MHKETLPALRLVGKRYTDQGANLFVDTDVELLIDGDDRMWPSVELAHIVVDRLERYGFTHPYEHASYPDAGHSVLGVPGTPTFATDVSTRFVLGGSPRPTPGPTLTPGRGC